MSKLTLNTYGMPSFSVTRTYSARGQGHVLGLEDVDTAELDERGGIGAFDIHFLLFEVMG